MFISSRVPHLVSDSSLPHQVSVSTRVRSRQGSPFSQIAQLGRLPHLVSVRTGLRSRQGSQACFYLVTDSTCLYLDRVPHLVSDSSLPHLVSVRTGLRSRQGSPFSLRQHS